MEVKGLSDLSQLPLWVDAIGISHPAAGHVLQPLVAVKAAAVLA